MSLAIVIPAYNPDDKLISLAQRLNQLEFNILIINDGSSPEYNHIFNKAKRFADVVGYEHNHGKGFALKFGFNKIIRLFPNTTHIITADCDGQHSVEDICKVCDCLNNGNNFVLTTRNLRGKIPTRSRIGNSISRFIYSLLNCMYLDDNQSGLRGFSIRHLDWMLKIDGDKYDYEMNVLFYAAKLGVKIFELPIKTIYIDGNKSSHFKPFQDTVRIYKKVLKTSRASIYFFVINLFLILLVDVFLKWKYFYIIIPGSVLLCSGLRFIVNKFCIFKNIKYSINFNTCVRNIVRALVYTIICYIFRIVHLDMFASFIITAAIVCILEYYLRKFIYFIKKHKS